MKLSEAIRVIRKELVECLETEQFLGSLTDSAKAIILNRYDRACAAVVKAQNEPPGADQELTAHLNRLDQQEEARSGN